MSGIKLEKRAEQVGILLAKKGITKAPTVRVGLALDVSGSAEWMFNNGVIQETVDRLLAVALKFDDNGELDVWSFSNSYDALPQATANDYNTYVKKNIIDNRNITKWYGTSYAPCMEAMRSFYFGDGSGSAKGFLGSIFGSKKPASAPNDTPAMILFVTDGSNDDRANAEKVLKAAQNSPVYWQMVGVGDPNLFGFLKQMADDLPNVGFVNLAKLDMTDDQLYDQLIADEFVEWVSKV